jgi:thiamine kinase-like enzyme
MREFAEAWLSRIPELAGARLIRRLSSGYRSEKWLCAGATEHYVLCVDKPVADCLRPDREAEFGLLQRLAGQALAPRPVACAPGMLVTVYLPGRTWTQADLTSLEQLRSVAELLRRLHSVHYADGVPLPLAEKLRSYARCSRASGADEEAAQALALLAGAAADPIVLCHHDPVVGNIIGDAEAMLIDWEYAAPGNRYFDLAAVLEHHGLDAAAESVFVKHYGKSMPVSGAEVQRWRQIYRHTCSLWAAAVAAG